MTMFMRRSCLLPPTSPSLSYQRTERSRGGCRSSRARSIRNGRFYRSIVADMRPHPKGSSCVWRPALTNAGRISLSASILWIFLGANNAAAQSTSPYFDDGVNYVYVEQQSCALYVDFEDGSMLRVSYRHAEGVTFVTLVGGDWGYLRMGQSSTIAVRLSDDRQSLVGLPVQGIVQPGYDERRGITGSTDGQIVERLVQSEWVQFERMDGSVTSYALPGIGFATEKLMLCSMSNGF